MPETPEVTRAGTTRRDPWLLIGVAFVTLIARIVLAVTQPEEEPTAAHAATVARRDLVRWVAAESAEAASRASGKPILYEFGADWCGPCKAMQRDVFSQSIYAGTIDGSVVPVRVTDRQREEGRNSAIVDSLQKVCNVSAFPTLALVSGGAVIDRQVGYPGAAVTMRWLARTRQSIAK